LLHYKAWAILAFGSMIIFAATQTILMALVQPLFDDVLMPPGKGFHVTEKHASREQTAKQQIIDTILNRDKPEGQRGWLINHVDSSADALNHWWNDQPSQK